MRFVQQFYAASVIVAASTIPVNAATVCTVTQTCERSHCPYIPSDNDAYKKQVYTAGCRAQALAAGYQFIRYVAGPAPQCKFAIKIDQDGFDCAQLD